MKEELVTAVVILYINYYKFYFNSLGVLMKHRKSEFLFLDQDGGSDRETKLEQATGLNQRKKLGHRDGIDSFFFPHGR